MDGENSKIPNGKESGEKGGQLELKAQGNTGTEGKECERDKGRKEEKSKQRSKLGGSRGFAKRIKLWLPWLSVCTEMSVHCDILPYSLPCCPAPTS